MRKFVSLFILLVIFIGFNPAVQAQYCILDTDIGDDIDDTWALAQILCSPELRLKLVVTDFNDTVAKAQITAKFLEQVGRTDVAVGIGKKINDVRGPQYEWAKDYDLKKYRGKVHEDGIGAMIDTIRAATETMFLFVIGPCPNIPEMLQRAPDVVDKVKVFAMSGSVYKGYGSNPTPEAEYNVRADIPAHQALYTAAWDLTIAPLDTCGSIVMDGKPYQKLLESEKKVVETLIENYRTWANGPNRHYTTDAHSSTLFDTEAVYLAYDQKFVEMKDLHIVVDDKGYTAVNPKGKVIHCAIGWKDKKAYIEDLLARLTSGVINEKFPKVE